MRPIDPVCMELPWDSRFFGLSIARVIAGQIDAAAVETIDAWCNAHRIDCLYFAADVSDRRTLMTARQNGFQLVDVRLTLEAATSPSTHRTAQTRLASEQDLPALEAIAADAHHDSRFYFDTVFEHSKCDELYRTWIRNSLHGYAQAVIVSGPVGEPTGYVTCHIGSVNRDAHIGLLAVRADARGTGVGGELVNAAMRWFAIRGDANVRVVTQGRNIASQRLYQRCGFQTVSTELFFHKWFSGRR